MPIKRRFSKRRELTLELLNQLAVGAGPLGDAELGEAWRIFREEILPLFENRPPLWAELRFDRGLSVPKSRRILLGDVHASLVAAWIERFLVYGQGDLYGRPFVLRPFQRELLFDAYTVRENGARQFRRIVWGLPKGAGKTPLAAAVAVAELCGPVANGRVRTAPDVIVAATSYEQANLLFGDAKVMVTEGPLARFCSAYETEITLNGLPGRLYRVFAAAGSNEGRRPTFFVFDELHELPNQSRLYEVLARGRAKRADAWQLAISTAGWDLQSTLGKLYTEAKRAEDPQLHMAWYEAPTDLDLHDPAQRERAIRIANPAAGDFTPLQPLLDAWNEEREDEYRRYRCNQWTAPPSHWMEAGVWEKAARPGLVVPAGADIVLGFDGSYNRDSTALVGAMLGPVPHLFLVGLFEPVAGAPVSRDAVLGAIDNALARWHVVRLAADDTFGRIWALDLEALKEKGLEVVEWPTRSQPRMAPAAGAFYGAVKDGLLTHDGDPRLAAHVANCVTRGTRYGPVPVKESQDSQRRIDAAIAAVITHDSAISMAEAGSWDFAGFSLPSLEYLGGQG